MNDLTEKCKKGELEDWQDYYVLKINGKTDKLTWMKNNSSYKDWQNLYGVKEVLAPVPSYDEWESMDRLEKIMLQERARLNKQVIELLEENDKLKEMLKDLRDKAGGALQAIQKDCESDDFSIFQYPEVQYFYDLLTKINQTLGGDK